MLAAILPGLRDLRTPLVAGYLYLLLAWLLLRDSVFRSAANSEWGQRLSELSNLLGVSATAAAVSFAAYLVGSVLSWRRVGHSGEKTFARLLRQVNQLPSGVYARIPSKVREWLRSRGQSASELDYETRRWIWDRLQRMLDRGLNATNLARSRAMAPDFTRALAKSLEHMHLDPPLDTAEMTKDQQRRQRENDNRVALEYALSGIIAAEFDLLAVRMQIERESLWNDYDRLRSEAELRFTLLPPLTLLVVVAAVMWTPFALLGLVLPVVLLRQGLTDQKAADQKVWQALTTEVIESPTMHEFLRLEVSDLNHSPVYIHGDELPPALMRGTASGPNPDRS